MDQREKFVELLTRHKGQLFGYIFSLVQNINDAEDVFQQASLVLWNKFSEFEVERSFLPWACGVAKFEVLNWQRRQQRERHYFSSQFIETVAVPDEDAAAAGDQRLEALFACLGRLSAADRKLLDLCYGGSRTTSDIAVDLGRSAGSVYDSLTRIRQALYHCIHRALRAEQR